MNLLETDSDVVALIERGPGARLSTLAQARCEHLALFEIKQTPTVVLFSASIHLGKHIYTKARKEQLGLNGVIHQVNIQEQTTRTKGYIFKGMDDKICQFALFKFRNLCSKQGAVVQQSSRMANVAHDPRRIATFLHVFETSAPESTRGLAVDTIAALRDCTSDLFLDDRGEDVVAGWQTRSKGVRQYTHRF